MSKSFNGVSIKRESFTRGAVMRRSAGQGVCDWCGRASRLWQYGWNGDSLNNRTSWQAKTFCCRSCERAYNA